MPGPPATGRSRQRGRTQTKKTVQKNRGQHHGRCQKSPGMTKRVEYVGHAIADCGGTGRRGTWIGSRCWFTLQLALATTFIHQRRGMQPFQVSTQQRVLDVKIDRRFVLGEKLRKTLPLCRRKDAPLQIGEQLLQFFVAFIPRCAHCGSSVSRSPCNRRSMQSSSCWRIRNNCVAKVRAGRPKCSASDLTVPLLPYRAEINSR